MTVHSAGFWRRLVVLGTAVALLAGACGGDEEPEQAAGADLSAFCDAYVTAELATIREEGNPQALFDEVGRTAPEEIRAEVVGVIANVSRALASKNPETVFDSEEFRELDEAVDQYLHANCDFPKADITGVEYAFDGVPETLPAGRVSFGFSNGGTEVHEMGLVRLKEGVEESAEEILQLPERESRDLIDPTSQFHLFAPPGETDAQVIELEQGRYIMFCFIAVGTTSIEEEHEAEGEPHAFRGMFAEFTVE